jgi:outer membrane protein OmpA-like peptidoglycan-associated protein
MEMIRGRTLPEVRRYDLWKLLIAALLFVNALFICGKPAPQAEAPRAVVTPKVQADPTAAPVAAPVAAPISAPVAAALPAIPAAAPVAPAVTPAPPPAPVVAAVALPKPPNAKLYFANNKTDVPVDVSKTLIEVIAWAKAAPANKLAISGFHSAGGSAERNHELAKGRANEVAAILKHAGVPDAQLEMRKPVEELGGSDPAQARRVEVGPAQ